MTETGKSEVTAGTPSPERLGSEMICLKASDCPEAYRCWHGKTHDHVPSCRAPCSMVSKSRFEGNVCVPNTAAHVARKENHG